MRIPPLLLKEGIHARKWILLRHVGHVTRRFGCQKDSPKNKKPHTLMPAI
jgi:hypothetical protein